MGQLLPVAVNLSCRIMFNIRFDMRKTSSVAESVSMYDEYQEQMLVESVDYYFTIIKFRVRRKGQKGVK